MSRTRALLGRIAEATTIRPPSAFDWLGERHEVAPGTLVTALAEAIYDGAYCTGGALRRPDPSGTPGVAGRTPFVESLSRANAGRGTRQSGWIVVEREESDLVLERLGVRALASAGEVVAAGRPEPGDAVALPVAKELLRALPGYYVAVGDLDSDDGSEAPLDRLYWNVRAVGARRLVAEVTACLNDARLPFRLKVPDDPHGFARCDAGVLYTRSADREAVLARVVAVRERLDTLLRARGPSFTLRVGRGLAFAEDPGNGGSFGLDRCRLVAEGLVVGGQRRSLGERVDEMLRCLERAGIDPEHPYLRPTAARAESLTAPVLLEEAVSPQEM